MECYGGWGFIAAVFVAGMGMGAFLWVLVLEKAGHLRTYEERRERKRNQDQLRPLAHDERDNGSGTVGRPVPTREG